MAESRQTFAMSILNVLLSANQLVVTVDTWAEDAHSGLASAGAKLLLIPQHQLLLATRGSAQFFLRIYQLCLEASFRADFTMEQLSAELGLVIDQLWPNYMKAVAEAGLPAEHCTTELVLGGWSPKNGRMMATAYAKHDLTVPAVVQPIGGQLASPGDPLRSQVLGGHARHPGPAGGSAAPGSIPQRQHGADRRRRTAAFGLLEAWSGGDQRLGPDLAVPIWSLGPFKALPQSSAG